MWIASLFAEPILFAYFAGLIGIISSWRNLSSNVRGFALTGCLVAFFSQFIQTASMASGYLQTGGISAFLLTQTLPEWIEAIGVGMILYLPFRLSRL